MANFSVAGIDIGLGETRDLALEVSQSYSGAGVTIPVRIARAAQPGPTLLLTAAVHGDELNGTGILRELISDPPFDLRYGTLIMVPVVNILGFERHTRYLPDRRDLNRSFPGSPGGSLASRFAYKILTELVARCDLCIDFHTAAVRRTNFPNIRGDLHIPEVERLARAFGCELLVDTQGHRGSLRYAACSIGCPTVTLEAGEVSKIEPAVVEVGLRGVRNVLIEYGMIEGEPERPPYQARVERTSWIRSDTGGLLSFHVGPGEVVEKNQPIASCLGLLGAERGVIRAAEDGVVMGLTTLPLVKPGDPVCHLAVPGQSIAEIRGALDLLPEESLHERLVDDLASSVTVDEPAPDPDPDPDPEG